MSGISNKAFNNAYFFSVFNNIIGTLIGVLTSAFLNRYLGVSLKGEYSYYLNIVNIIAIFAGFGLVQSYPAAKRKGLKDVKSKYFLICITQFLIILFISVILAVIFKSDLFYINLLHVPCQVLATQLGYITTVEVLKKSQKMYIYSTVLYFFLIMIAYFIIPQYLYSIFIILLIKNIVSILYYSHALKEGIKFITISHIELLFIFRFSVVAMITTLLLDINYKVDVVMLGNLVTSDKVGLYSTGAGLANYIWILPDAFKNVLFSKTAHDDAINDINWSIKISMISTVICMIGLLVFGKSALYILYGCEFVPAYAVTCIIMFGAPSMILFKLTNNLFLANSKQRFYLLGLTVSAAVNIIMNVVLIPNFGINGAAFASVFSYSVCGLTFYIRYLHDYHVCWYVPLIVTKNDICLLKDKFMTAR